MYPGAPDEVLKKYIAMIDTDGDSMFSKNEFRDPKATGGMDFLLTDKDKSDTVDASEIIAKYPTANATELKQWLRNSDKDGD